jgi:hypothetical protein
VKCNFLPHSEQQAKPKEDMKQILIGAPEGQAKIKLPSGLTVILNEQLLCRIPYSDVGKSVPRQAFPPCTLAFVLPAAPYRVTWGGPVAAQSRMTGLCNGAPGGKAKWIGRFLLLFRRCFQFMSHSVGVEFERRRRIG